MCVGKMYWAGIRSVVYALPAEELAALAGGSFVVPCRELFARAADRVHVTGPLLVDEAREVHQGLLGRRLRRSRRPAASQDASRWPDLHQVELGRHATVRRL